MQQEKILNFGNVARSSLMDLDPPRSICLSKVSFCPLRCCMTQKPMLKILATLYLSYRNPRRPSNPFFLYTTSNVHSTFSTVYQNDPIHYPARSSSNDVYPGGHEWFHEQSQITLILRFHILMIYWQTLFTNAFLNYHATTHKGFYTYY